MRSQIGKVCDRARGSTEAWWKASRSQWHLRAWRVGVAAIELGSATIVRCACSRSIVPSSRQSGVRMAIVCNVERSAVLRRVEVCCTLSSAIAIVLGVRGSVCDECVCAEQSVRASSAINACAAAATSSARSAIARMARTCVAVWKERV